MKRLTLMMGGAVVLVGLSSSTALANPEACCFKDGTCQVLLPVDCAAQGGNRQGFGSTCDTASCGGDGSLTCRITGGGVDCFDGVFRDGDCTGAIGKARKVGGINGYTFGGQAGAPDGGHGEWTHVQHTGPDGQWTFHAGTSSAPDETFINVVECTDPPACSPAVANAPNKQIDFSGVGQFKNIIEGTLGGAVARDTLHPFAVHIEDLGEPGRSGKQGPDTGCSLTGHSGGTGDCDCPDFYHITIWNPAGTAVIYEVFGYITGGNLQMHPALD